jgi:chemotaxis protein CheD
MPQRTAAPGAMPQRPAAPGAATAAAPRPAAGQKLTVGIADMKILQGDGEIITYALGSCIGICLWDPPLKLGALIHIMLPLNMEPGRKNTMKYADTGIKETLNLLTAKGARKDRLVAKIAGGAKMFEVAGNSNLGNIGARNIESVKLNLRKEGIKLLAENVGGSVARTLSFYPATGVGEIRAYGQPVITL